MKGLTVHSTLCITALAGALLVLACEGPFTPETGTLGVQVVTTGVDPDSNGYFVSLDNGSPRPVSPNGSTEFTEVSPSQHQLSLTGIAPNCASGDSTRMVTVPANGSQDVSFDVACMKNAGVILVTVTTSGGNADPDGYELVLDGHSVMHIQDNGNVAIYDVAAGRHAVMVAGVAPNCIAEDTALVDVGFHTYPSVALRVACSNAQLVFSLLPTNWTAGMVVAPAVVVAAQDSQGHTLTGFSDSVTIALGSNSAGGTLSGTTQVRATNGIATFATLKIDRAGSGYTLTATGKGLVSASSQAFNVSPGRAGRLAFWVQPAITLVGTAIAPAVQVAAVDSGGNIDTAFTGDVTVAIGSNPGAGTLAGTTTVQTVAGVATFSTLSIDRVGSGYTLTAATTGLTGATSTAFDIAGTRLAFTVQPTSQTAGAVMTPAVQVTAQNADGSVATGFAGNITISIWTNPGGATLSGTATMPAVNGVATFSTLKLNRSGIGYTLKAVTTGVVPGTSASFDITSGPANQLGFTVQPSNTPANATITPAVQVTAQDAAGNTATGFSGNVTVSIGTNPAGGTLSGTTTVAAVNGVATFADLAIAQQAPGYTLTAASGSLAGTTSASFTIEPPLSTLRVTVATAGDTLDPNGYTVCVDPSYSSYSWYWCAAQAHIADSGSVSYTVSAGSHTVQLQDVAFPICTVTGGDTKTVSVPAGGTGDVVFVVSCAKPGTVRITTTTTGTARDPDGYTACVSYAGCYHMGNDSVLSIAGVPAADQTVSLRGIAENCSVNGDSTRTVTVPEAAIVDVAFQINCVGGTVHVTTVTTGDTLDPDGYAVCVTSYANCSSSTNPYSPIGDNDSKSFELAPGNYSVWLFNVSPFCVVNGGNPVSAAVAAGGVSEVAFAVTCVKPGTVHITTTTTGTDLDPDGYLACVDIGGCANLPINGTGAITGVRPGIRTFALSGVTANCTPSISPGDTLNVPEGGTVEVTIQVTCVKAERVIAFDDESAGGISLMTVQGGNLLHIVPVGWNPAWSPDGTQIAFVGQSGGVSRIQADGTGPTPLLAGDSATSATWVAWRPDGARLAFSGRYNGTSGLYLMNADGTGVTPLTTVAGVYHPTWSPDGTRLAFECVIDAGNTDICAINGDGTGFVRLTTDPVMNRMPAWKPDGSKILFLTGYVGLATMNPDGTAQVPVLQYSYLNGSATWSPDGQRIAFTVYGSCYSSYSYCAPDQILVVKADGTDLTTINTAGNNPAWRP